MTHPTLFTRMLITTIQDFAKEKKLSTARVQWKVNAKGELVVALIIPPITPGVWSPL